MKMLFYLLLILPISAFCGQIECFSCNKVVYKGIGHEISYNQDFLIFKEDKTGKTVFIFGECVVKF